MRRSHTRLLGLDVLSVAAGAAALPTGATGMPADHHAALAARPMRVEGASEAIVRATVTGPQCFAPELFAAIEDYHNPRLKRLRDDYGLDKVVAGEPNEFRRLLKLRHWVHSRWPIDNEQGFGGDAFAILEKAKT